MYKGANVKVWRKSFRNDNFTGKSGHPPQEYPIRVYNGFEEYIKTRIRFRAGMGFAVNAPPRIWITNLSL